MSKIAIVYWSGTGNTEAMAKCIEEGVKAAGGEAVLMGIGEFSPTRFSEFSAVAFGCPAMGSEQLEGSLSGKNIALFGSYGWGDGQWMRDWCSRCDNAGANLLDENGLMANEAPDDAMQESCRDLGRRLAAW